MAKGAIKAATTRDPILVDLALQGGGSHGAFTWGVLDRLLEEPWLGIDGISGTSAGAMNAAVLVDGHSKAGPRVPRTALENFWLRVSEAARFTPLRRGPLDVILGGPSITDAWSFLDSKSGFPIIDRAEAEHQIRRSKESKLPRAKPPTPRFQRNDKAHKTERISPSARPATTVMT
jgi:predicted acylesterase/phospholipase RssA